MITLDNQLTFSDDIRSHIHNIRGVQVMLDEELATLYGVATKRLNEQVKRNIERFPDQFCFQLTKVEYQNLKSQIATSNTISRLQIATLNQRSQLVTFDYGGRRKLPFVFTEQGVAMLSGVLKSEVAVRVSIQIMSEFVAMRKVIQTNSQIFTRLEVVEQKQLVTDQKINQVFDALAGHDEIPKQKLYFDGETFDAHIFVSKIIRSANESIILVDNFVDEAVLALLTKRKDAVKATIYCKKISSDLRLDLKKHNSQYPPIEINEFSNSHDRFLIIDHLNIYHFGASIKDLGKKWCAVSKLEISSIEMLQRL